MDPDGLELVGENLRSYNGTVLCLFQGLDLLEDERVKGGLER